MASYVSGVVTDIPKESSPIGKEIQNFRLQNVDGKAIGLENFPQAKGFVIVFTCNHCPFAKLYSRRFNDLSAKYRSLGIPLLAVNSMDTSVYDEERFANMQERAKVDHFEFPYLQDPLQTVGKQFSADHTPQAFVIWKEAGKWMIKYSGAIDDNGKHPEKATPFVANAIDELLASKPVSHPEYRSLGCAINYRE